MYLNSGRSERGGGCSGDTTFLFGFVGRGFVGCSFVGGVFAPVFLFYLSRLLIFARFRVFLIALRRETKDVT